MQKKIKNKVNIINYYEISSQIKGRKLGTKKIIK